jgi:A/G-specific adenine glycosylase
MNISEIMINWYEENQRDLPWRKTRDPYLIWISEIMLQQTRVQQGIGYYHRFVGRFPDLHSLAEATEDEVLRYWQGLGYYSRARNLHETAQLLVKNFKGQFPRTFRELLALKGIGEYTAAAIASVAFNEEVPVVDGNVLRFMSRLYSISIPIDTTEGKKAVTAVVSGLIKGQDPLLFNQAIMELGALICKPKSPQCDLCPLVQYCGAFNNHQIANFPVKVKKTKVRVRYFNYFLVEAKSDKDTGIFLEKRTSSDIWKNLYELPLIETEGEVQPEELIQRIDFPFIAGGSFRKIKSISPEYKHQLSHQLLKAVFYRIEIDWPVGAFPGFFFVSLQDIKACALPRLIERYLQDVKIIL